MVFLKGSSVVFPEGKDYLILRERRVTSNLTQQQVAEMLNVTRSAYSLWEINKNVIPLIKLNDFCNSFDINMDYVCNLSNDKHNNFNHIELDKKEIGKRLKQTRKELKLTQEKFINKAALQTVQRGYTKGMRASCLQNNAVIWNFTVSS